MLKKVFYVIVAFVCIAGILSLGGCVTEKKREQNARDRIKEITEIEVPIDSEIIFNYKADKGFPPGRAEQFTVFEFNKEPTDWLEENKFLSSDDETKTEDGHTTLVRENESGFWSYFKIENIDKRGIPKEYVPNCEKNYFWLRPQNVYFFYYPDTLRLIVYIAWS